MINARFVRNISLYCFEPFTSVINGPIKHEHDILNRDKDFRYNFQRWSKFNGLSFKLNVNLTTKTKPSDFTYWFSK